MFENGLHLRSVVVAFFKEPVHLVMDFIFQEFVVSAMYVLLLPSSDEIPEGLILIKAAESFLSCLSNQILSLLCSQ